MWEHFHHQADIGVRGIGATAAEAFAEGAYALMAVICSPDKVKPIESVEIRCEAPELDLLFADWLNELIYEIDTRGMLFSKFDVEIEGEELRARAWGELADANRHDFAVMVKAATYMELKTSHDNDGRYFAQCVVDV
ncbi:MAG: archease [Sedimentisphaerales bacterium]|nr:archease [Sedimentisphaerales bacterium]